MIGLFGLIGMGTAFSEDNKKLIALGWEDDYYLYSFDLSKVNLEDN